MTYTLTGQQYSRIDLLGNTVVNLPNGGAKFVTTRAHRNGLDVGYQLPLTLLPVGRTVVNVDTVACGSASGDFYELYGPFNALPVEYEIIQPGPDGCWHFTKDDGSTYHVSIYLSGDATMTIDHITFTVTFAT